jgi:hypothetical protein
MVALGCVPSSVLFGISFCFLFFFLKFINLIKKQKL